MSINKYIYAYIVKIMNGYTSTFRFFQFHNVASLQNRAFSLVSNL
jgi:hypothetical protein